MPINHSPMDKFKFERNARKEGLSRTEKEFRHDIFEGLYQPSPVLEKSGDNLLQEKLLEDMMKSIDFKLLHNSTRNNEVKSYVSSKTFYDGFQKIENQNQKLADETDNEKFEKMWKGRGEFVKLKIKDLLHKVEDEIESVEDGLKVLGYSMQSGTQDENTKDEIMKLVEILKNNSELREIIDKAGRNIMAMNHAMETKVKEPGEIIGFKMGNDLTNVIPDELARLAHPVEKILFMLDFIEENLIEYETETTKPESKGPIVICEDQSDSMNYKGRVKMKFSKAFLLSIFSKAKLDNRPCYMVRFSNDDQCEAYELNQDNLISSITKSYNGGTCFETPLRKALEIIKNQSKFKNADIMFLSDGCAPVSDEMLEEIKLFKKKEGLKIIGVEIELDRSYDVLPKFCDVVHRIFDCTSDTENRKLMEALV